MTTYAIPARQNVTKQRALPASSSNRHYHTMPNELAFADNSRLARNKTPPPRITKRVRDAVDAIVERGLPYDQAAAQVGLSTYALRLALGKPHVAAYLQAQLKVLRGARSPRNFHRLCEIADADNNMPAVNAIKALEQLSDEQTNTKQTTSPGVTIRIVNVSATPAQHEQTISATSMQHDQRNADE